MAIHVKTDDILTEYLRTQEVIRDRQARRGQYDGIPELPKEKKKKRKKEMNK